MEGWGREEDKEEKEVGEVKEEGKESKRWKVNLSKIWEWEGLAEQEREE